MVLAYGAARGIAPPYLQAMLKPYTRALRSVTSGLLVFPLSPVQAPEPLPLTLHLK